jgi:hypothetical protein
LWVEQSDDGNSSRGQPGHGIPVEATQFGRQQRRTRGAGRRRR